MAKASLYEIARQSGVSHVTVSRILGDKANLHRPETVERVRRVARELGYRPNLVAKSMQSGHTRTIGFMLRADTGGWAARLQVSVHEALVQAGYLPITLTLSPGVPDLEQVHHLLDRRVDGIIVRPAHETVTAEHLQEILRQKVPVAAVDLEPPAEFDLDFVGTDDDIGGRLVAEHLLELGHRQFCLLRFEGRAAMLTRLASFEAVVAQTAGASCNTAVCPLPADGDAYESIQAALSADPRPTAVFAASDKLACAVYQVASALGLRVPEDLSIVGFADMEYARLVNPPLTTIRQHPEAMGREVVRLLLERIDGEGAAEPATQRILLPPELIVRRSTRALS